MKAVIYARYSSHNQKEESIEGQLRECYDFAQKHEIDVIGEYCDRALSGKTDKRPAFQQMIKDSERGRFDAVILYTLDRFARNRYDSAIYKSKLKKNGVKLYYAKQPLPDTPEGIILESVLEGYAEYYSENLARGVKRGMHEKALQCVALGKAPLGYKIGPDKHFEIDPLGANAVRIIFDMFLDGKPQKEIISYLNEHGYTTTSGGPFMHSSLSLILSNDKYTGIYRHADVVVPGGMPVIIDKDTFDKVQVMLEKNKNSRGRRKAKVDYLLSGKIFCGHCKQPMIGESGRSRNGEVHNYYKCKGRKNKLNDCSKHTEKKKWIERVVVDQTVRYVLTDENIQLISRKVIELMNKELEDNSILAGLKHSLQDTERKISNIMKAIEEGLFTSSTKARLDELETLRDTLLIEIEDEKRTVPDLTEPQIIFMLKSLQNGNPASLDYQRKVIDALVSSVFVYDDEDNSKGRKIVVNFNLSRNNRLEVDCSDITLLAPHRLIYPNIEFLFTPKGFSVVFHAEVN